MQIDEAINKLNLKYVFKIIAFLVLSFPTFQNYGQMQAILLALVTPNHTCKYNRNITINHSVSPDQCTVIKNGSVEKCRKWNFSLEPVGKTMMSDYELVCERKNYGDTILLVWYLTSFSAIVMGWLSDKYGRKKVALVNLALETVASICLAYAPNVYINMVFRFFIGVSSCSIYITYVWLMESVNIEFRKFVGSFFWMYGCIAYMIFPLLVFMTKNWRHTQLLSILPNMFYVLIFFIPESPRWLFVMGRRREAFASMRRICELNEVDVEFENEDIVVENESQNGSMLRAWRSSVFVSRSLLTLLIQFSTGLIYMGVTVNIAILSNNVLLSIFLLGLMETPGLFLSFFCLHKLKRKKSLLIFSTIGSTLFWASVFFNRDNYIQSIIRVIVGCIAKAIIASVNQTTMVYVSELFPTSHRSFGFVCVQLASFLSFVGALYINKLENVYFFLPMTIYMVLIFTSCLLALVMLPETKDLPFPETLDDQKALRIGHEKEYESYMKAKELSDYAYSTETVEVT